MNSRLPSVAEEEQEAAVPVFNPPVFNPFDASWRNDPYPLYQKLRNEAPVGQVPGIGVWYVSRFEDCQSLLRDPTLASSDPRKSGMAKQMKDENMRGAGDLRETRSFLFLDPPDHTRLRGLVASTFTPKMIERVKPRIHNVVERLLDAAEERGSLELVREFAYPLTLTMICEMLGIPPRDEDRFRGWSEQLAGSMDPKVNAPPEVVQRQQTAMKESTEYLLDLMAQRRRNPGDDLISSLFAAEFEGHKLTEEELLSSVILVFAAGHETSVHLQSNSVLALLTHPEQLAAVKRDGSLYRNVVEETLRWDPMIQLTQRIALREMSIGGFDIKAGSPIMIILAAANRDERELPDGESFIVTRPRFPHLAFGFGPHFCVGAALARAECEDALRTIFGRFPNLHLGPRGFRRLDTLVFRGLSELHTEF